MTCVVPAGIEGEVQVTVTTEDGTSNSLAFDRARRRRCSRVLDPTSGVAGSVGDHDRDRVRRYAGDFERELWERCCASYTSWTDTQVVCLVPAGVEDEVQVTVTTEDGTSNAGYLRRAHPAGALGHRPGKRGCGLYGDPDRNRLRRYARDLEHKLRLDPCCLPTPPGPTPRWSAWCRPGIRVGTGHRDHRGRHLQRYYLRCAYPPVLSGIDPTSGVAGSSVTITGTDFGATQGTSSVSFGGIAVSSYTSWTDTQVVCLVPAGTNGSVQVTVTTTGGTSNGVTFDVLDRRQCSRTSTRPAGLRAHR